MKGLKKAINFATMAILFCGSVFLLTACDGDTVTIDVASYANFNSRWEYQNNEVGYETPCVEVLGTDTKNGKQVYILQEYDPAGFPNDQSYYLADMSSGLYSLGGINNYQDVDEYEFFWEPEMPYLLASFVPGQEYEFQSTSSYDNSTVMGTISIQSESVTVPAGTFTDCYKVILSGTYNDENFTYYRWYAKNVGLVKRIGFGGGTWELVAYSHDGFTAAELAGNSFQLTDIDYPTCTFDVIFNLDNTLVTPDGETVNYTLENGSIIMTDSVTTTISVQSRNGSSITANLSTVGGSFEDRTDQWGTDFSTLNNDATALKDWFVTNSWWPGSALLADGRVTNQAATFDGNWWIDNNVLYIAHPEDTGCVDYKAYKLVNDRLMFATDGDHTSTYTMVKY